MNTNWSSSPTRRTRHCARRSSRRRPTDRDRTASLGHCRTTKREPERAIAREHPLTVGAERRPLRLWRPRCFDRLRALMLVRPSSRRRVARCQVLSCGNTRTSKNTYRDGPRRHARHSTRMFDASTRLRSSAGTRHGKAVAVELARGCAERIGRETGAIRLAYATGRKRHAAVIAD